MFGWLKRKYHVCNHDFTDYSIGFQDLGSLGIAYDFQCCKCKEVWHVNLHDQIKVRDYIKDKGNRNQLARYIKVKGFKSKSKKLMFKRN